MFIKLLYELSLKHSNFMIEKCINMSLVVCYIFKFRQNEQNKNCSEQMYWYILIMQILFKVTFNKFKKPNW